MTTKGKTKSARKYSETTLKVLFAFSGNKCAWPDCDKPIVASQTEFSSAKVIGHIAHIYAHSDGGPRSKPGLTDADRRSPENLILFCPTHHVIVDKQEETYPATLLIEWKQRHERHYQESLSTSIANVGFEELEVAAKALMASQGADGGWSVSSLPPKEKLKKNKLGATCEMLLTMGAAKSQEVESVLLRAAQLDSGFPERLRDGFIARYAALFGEGLRGDDLFMAVYDWAGGTNTSKQRQAAGLCILSHLFIICDVFEK